MTILGNLLAGKPGILLAMTRMVTNWSQKEEIEEAGKRVDGETHFNKEIAGAPGRTRTRDTRFSKPNTHDSDSPTEWVNPGSRLTSSFFCVPTNLAEFASI